MYKSVLTALAAIVWSGSAFALPCAGFTDVEDTSPFCTNVEWVRNRAITLGCVQTGDLYCPVDSVTRLQMAVFMNRLGNALFPLNCAGGSVMKWNGTAWACAPDADTNTGGTVTNVATGTGLTGGPITTTGTIGVSTTYLQRRVSTTCAAGSSIRAIAEDGAVTCEAAGGGGSVTNVATGTGLTGGPITTTGTIGVNTTYLQRRVAANCAAGSSIRAIAEDGAVTCETDDTGGSVTNVATGTGLTGGPITTTGTIGVNTTYLQRRVAANCAAGSSIRAIAEDGTVTCETDDAGGSVTSVATGAGLTGGPITTTGTIGVSTTYLQRRVSTACAAGSSIRAIAEDGAVTCEAAAAGVTSVATGPGLTGGPITTTGTINVSTTYLQRRVATCAAGSSIRAIAEDGAVTCETDDTGGTGSVTSVATGAGLTGGPITTAGTIGVDPAVIQSRVSATCAAGSSIRAIGQDGSVTCETDDTGAAGNAFVQNGNAFTAEGVLGTTDNFALDVRVNNLRVVRYEPSAISPNLIAGYNTNAVTPGVRGATIAGGGAALGMEPINALEGPNLVTDAYGTIGGGYSNQAGNNGGTVEDSPFATVAGGLLNRATGFAATIGGGDGNDADGSFATIGGGQENFASGGSAPTVSGGLGNRAEGSSAVVSGGRDNVATGDRSAIPGGYLNLASGAYSFAAGRRAKSETAAAVVHDGAFVWADSSDFDFRSSANNEFAVRATGGMRVVLAIDGAGAATTTCTLTGVGGWSCPSDRNLKQNFRKLDGQEVLSRVAAMPVYAWNPKGTNAHQLHYGPTAQDFHAAFGLGDSNVRIGQQDADGVALAAIQGVNEKLDQREAALRREIDAKSAEVAELKRQIADLRDAQSAEVAELRKAVEILMARTSAEGRIAQAR